MRKYKLGEIVYPFQNGSLNKFLKKAEYHLITDVGKDGNWKRKMIFYDHETIRVIELLIMSGILNKSTFKKLVKSLDKERKNYGKGDI